MYMKILPVACKYASIGLLGGALLYSAPKMKAQNILTEDKVELSLKIPPSGTTDSTILLNAPIPKFKFMGENKFAKIVVDVTNNVLYHFDDVGKPLTAYLIATGKPSTPTSTGFRRVTHIETFPYKGAPRSSKRRRDPKSYGPKIICLEKININSGETATTGEFIHGNNNFASLGKKASHGCMRMDNEVIQYLAKIIKRGDFVIIKK